MASNSKKVDFSYPTNLRFSCNKCGICCGDTEQKTRHVLILEAEAKAIAAQTGQDISDFSFQISDKLPFRFEMKKTSEGKCVFLKENQCTIYEVRPLICRFYPFELKFDKDMQLHVFDFTLECPGIGQGKEFEIIEFEKLFDLAEERLPQSC
jgi:Fe-S-cluster containining protein